VGEVKKVVSACVLRATTKEKVVNFFGEEKCTPDKILAMPMNPTGNYESLHTINKGDRISRSTQHI